MSDLQGIEARVDLDWLDRSVATFRFPASDAPGALDGAGRGTVLILHGLGDHIGRYDWAIPLFREAGYEVFGIDWPGCGASSGIRGDLPMIADGIRMVDEILTGAGVSPVGVIGHSTGGFFLAHLLAAPPASFARLNWAWFSSPLLDPGHGQNRLKIAAAKVLAQVIPKFTLSTGVYPRDCFHTGGGPEARVFAEGVHNRISLRFGREILDPAKLPARVAGRIAEDIAVLISQGAEDHVCAPELVEPFLQALPGRKKALLYVSGARHEPFREPGADSFLAQVRAWLAGR